jgi:hypothetical protein
MTHTFRFASFRIRSGKSLLLQVMREWDLEELDRTIYLEPVVIKPSSP